MTATARPRGRPAHTPGSTYLTYTPNGRRLITAGSNNIIRIYTTGSDGEPVNIDDSPESMTAVVATNDFCIAGAEDGTVSLYSLETNSFQKILVRSSLPIRDIALSPDGRWAAVASDELVVKIVDIEDPMTVLHLREQPKPVKHLSYHPSGQLLSVSCSDGIIYIYNLANGEPELLKKLDGVIRALETDVDITSDVAWHPDGRAFASATSTRDVQVVSKNDWQPQRKFSGHTGDITAVAWSHNGALLATAATDGHVLLWETKSQTIIARYEYANVMRISWHPTNNLISFTTSEGELFIYKDIIPKDHEPLLEKTLQRAPLLQESSREIVTNQSRPVEPHNRRERHGTPDSLDAILDGDDDAMDEDDNFVEDDDGAGYAGVNGHGKRTNGHLDTLDPRSYKRFTTQEAWTPKFHSPFQPGSTPWRGNRRYLSLNLTGFVWTVNQESHHTVTVEFYDREFHRDFHFTDPYMYDKACLSDNGTLFSCPPRADAPAMLFYRPHETWTTRTDWRTELPEGEDILAISLSNSYVVAITSKNYIRVYTLYGTPFRVYRQKSFPGVTIASWRDYVMTMGNGAVGSDGRAKLVYTIENVRRDEVCQNEDTVALTEGAEVKSVFFSDSGDPCIYDSTGVLLILQHWRTPGQARWIPLLETKQLARLAGGRKEETYWPVAVAQDRFHCIILKGGDLYPYFPRPLLSEFDFEIPISTVKKPARRDDEDEDDQEDSADPNKELQGLEQTYLQSSLNLSLLSDQVASSSHSTADQRSRLAAHDGAVAKALLQLLAHECRLGEERGMKALELVRLLRDAGEAAGVADDVADRRVEAARKVAGRFGRGLLEEKIGEMVVRSEMGLEGEE